MDANKLIYLFSKKINKKKILNFNYKKLINNNVK